MGCGCGKNPRQKKNDWKAKRVAAKIAELPKTKANEIKNGKGKCAKCGKTYNKKKLRAWGKKIYCVNCVRIERMKAKKV